MSCSRIRSELFYLAEDDTAAGRELDAHLAECANCSREWQQYRILLRSYQSTCVESAPALRKTVKPTAGWRVARIAAVLGLVTLIGSIWPRHLKEDAIRQQASNGLAARSWDPPPVSMPKLMIDSRDIDFSTRVETLRNSIARLQSQTSTNRF